MVHLVIAQNGKATAIPEIVKPEYVANDKMLASL